jgi:hypothetical protein
MLEATGRELQRGAWPAVRARVKKQNIRTKYKGIDKNGTLHFETTSGTVAGKTYEQLIQFVDLQDVVDIVQEKGNTLRAADLVRLMLAGGVKVYCNDPSFLYFGWQYMAWKQGHGINQELRPPSKRNPHQTGSVCKHLVLVLQAMPFYAMDIMRDMRKEGLLPQQNKKSKTDRQGAEPPPELDSDSEK